MVVVVAVKLELSIWVDEGMRVVELSKVVVSPEDTTILYLPGVKPTGVIVGPCAQVNVAVASTA